MKTEEEIKSKIIRLKYAKAVAFKKDNDHRYKMYSQMVKLLEWILDDYNSGYLK